MAELDPNVTPETETVETNNEPNEEINSELAALKADLAKQKIALDKANKEAADYKRQLRAKQSAEEVAAEEKRILDEERDKQLAEYKKLVSVEKNAKKLMSFVGDEPLSTELAGHLYGAEDEDAVIDLVNKAWTAREKKLRIEYGKIPAPGVGSTEGSSMTLDQLNAMTYKDRNEFAMKYPQDYARLMGRA